MAGRLSGNGMSESIGREKRWEVCAVREQLVLYLVSLCCHPVSARSEHDISFMVGDMAISSVHPRPHSLIFPLVSLLQPPADVMF